MDPDRITPAVQALLDLVARLRGPDGCPWDKKQTPSSIRLYLLEEAYEVVDAIERATPGDVCAELGDLLFQIVFLAHLGAEDGDFDFLEVTKNIVAKMVRRHPHVFGDKTIENAEEVAVNWAEIKRAEQGGSVLPRSSLEGVPASLPALLYAHRLSERASKLGFDWTSLEGVYEKVLEEVGELKHAMRDGERDQVAEELGDFLFSVVNLARHSGFNAEDLLRQANRKFLKRFRAMEDRLNEADVTLSDASPSQMEKAWEAVKSEE